MKAPLLHEGDGRLSRAARLAIGLGVASLLGGIVLALLQEKQGWIRSSGADGYSRSALGHSAWIALLRASGAPTQQSRRATASRATEEDVVVIAEPRLEETKDGVLLAEVIAGPAPAIVVLPRRAVLFAEGGHAQLVYELDESTVADVARRVVALPDGVTVVRAKVDGWTTNVYGAELVPDLVEAQLLQGSDLFPMVECDAGILVGRTESWPPRILVADPDLVATHRIGHGANAALAVELVENVRKGSGTVWYDEVVHGYGAAASPWLELFEPPLRWLTLHALVATLLLAWAALLRFGRARAPQPALAAGKAALLENIAELMEAGGHAGHSARRAFDDALAAIAAALHGPRALDGAARRGWLRGRLRDDALRAELASLEAAALRPEPLESTTAALAFARRVHAWKEKVLHAAR